MDALWSQVTSYFAHLSQVEALWLGIGFFGQGLFFSRWILQWIISEREAKSSIPIAFWYMSLAGGLIVLSYAIHRKDPVFIVGQSLGAFVYFRNLVLIHRSRKQAPSG